jgi:hypothetical protein
VVWVVERGFTALFGGGFLDFGFAAVVPLAFCGLDPSFWTESSSSESSAAAKREGRRLVLGSSSSESDMP